MDERQAPTPVPALERLPARRRMPIALGFAICASLGLLVWAPWRPADSSAPRAALATAAPAPDVTARSQPPTPSSGSSILTAPVTVSGSARYESIVDNEWTIVAFLTVGPGPSVEEPAGQHVDVAAPSPEGPFVVLQQGLIPVAAPLEQPGRPVAQCSDRSPPRDQRVVHLPRGRVVYLGVTFPGMDRRATVEARVLGGPNVELQRSTAVQVQLAGMQPGVRYTVPTTGPGGTILFTAASAAPRSPAAPPTAGGPSTAAASAASAVPAARLPTAPYRFELRIPGLAGPRYLYACVDA